MSLALVATAQKKVHLGLFVLESQVLDLAKLEVLSQTKVEVEES